jgi:hypothetical protein
MITRQQLLILSFFDEKIPREINDKDLTTDMVEEGIGSNSSARYQYFEIVHELINNGLLLPFREPSKVQNGIKRAVGKDLLVLSEKAVQILQRDEQKSIHKAFVTEFEFNKLLTEHNLLARQLADYKINRVIAWLALIISAIALFASLLTKK